MGYMKSTDSAVLAEFGRIMSEKDGLKKTAQAVAPLSDEEKAKLQHAIVELTNTPSNGPAMERWISRLNGQTDPYLKQVHDLLSQRYKLWSEGKSAAEIGSILLPSQDTGVAARTKQTAAPVIASSSAQEKTAEQKAYDVTGKEDMVQEAHPTSAKIESETVENLNEQQKADKAVAEKSAKDILLALYKLAKRLKAEKNEKAYALVKETFLDLSKSFKK